MTIAVDRDVLQSERRMHLCGAGRLPDRGRRVSSEVAAGVQLPQDFDPLCPETFTSFHEEFAALRQSCPVAHSDAWNGFWALLRYEDVVSAAKDPTLFTTGVQNVVPKLAFTGRRPPLHLDLPEHTPYRRALNPYFSPEKMDAIEPSVRRIVGELLQELVDHAAATSVPNSPTGFPDTSLRSSST